MAPKKSVASPRLTGSMLPQQPSTSSTNLSAQLDSVASAGPRVPISSSSSSSSSSSDAVNIQASTQSTIDYVSSIKTVNSNQWQSQAFDFLIDKASKITSSANELTQVLESNLTTMSVPLPSDQTDDQCIFNSTNQ